MARERRVAALDLEAEAAPIEGQGPELMRESQAIRKQGEEFKAFGEALMAQANEIMQQAQRFAEQAQGALAKAQELTGKADAIAIQVKRQRRALEMARAVEGEALGEPTKVVEIDTMTAGLAAVAMMAKQLGKKVRLTPGARLELVPEPTNKHDPNAIKVMLDGEQVAYVARESAQRIAEKMRKKGWEIHSAHYEGPKGGERGDGTIAVRLRNALTAWEGYNPKASLAENKALFESEALGAAIEGKDRARGKVLAELAALSPEALGAELARARGEEPAEAAAKRKGVRL